MNAQGQEQNKNPISGEWAENIDANSSEHKILSKFSKTSRWFFWIFLAVAITALAVAGFYFYQYNSASEVDLAIEVPFETLAGVPFEMKIRVQNNSDKQVEGTTLSIILPQNSAFMEDNGQNGSVINKEIGILEKGETYQNSFLVMVFGTKDIVQKFNASVYYYPPAIGPSARFEKNESANVSVREPAISLDLSAPQKILNNEDFEITAFYQNISEFDFPEIRLKMEYPSSFAFKESSPVPASGNNSWIAESFEKISDGETIKIKGKVFGPENSFFDIKFSAFLKFNGKEYLINEKTANLNIAQSPLSLSIMANDDPNYYALPNSSIKYKANYRNNSDTGLSDVVIKLQLIGEMFDPPSLSTKGSFNSQTNAITFNASNYPELRVLSPGASGQVEFSIRTDSFYPIRRVSDKNFTLKVKGEISSPTVPYYVASDKTVGVTELETKIGGKAEIDSQAFFYDPSSGISNAGPLPVKVNNPTNFTIHWIITNYSTDIKNVIVKSFLASGVKWTNIVKSNISSVPAYNENTQEVSWLIDQIPATKGIANSPIEAIFQIEATPNITQIGNPMTLLGITSLSAIDQFINVQLTDSDSEQTTRLPDDPTVGYNQETVVQ